MLKLVLTLLIGTVVATCCQEASAKGKLTLNAIFPQNRVIDIQITVKESDWDTLRFQARTYQNGLNASRKDGEFIKPYSYVSAKMSIDGVDLGTVGIRKKGFLGSQHTIRPSLKVKLDYKNKKADIEGLDSLTLNNNRQDRSFMSQFIGYRLFNNSGTPAPRCSYAKVTVNGVNLGVYSHVESAKKPLVKRGFGNDEGVLYEGTVTDFHEGWEKSFQRKFGKDKLGRPKIVELINALKGKEGQDVFDSEKATAHVFVPTADAPIPKSWQLPEFDDSKWLSGLNGAGFETQSGFESAISEELDLREMMWGKSPSVLIRIPFDVEDPESLPAGNLYLKMKYDDGFVAFLNGERVAAAFAPDELNWDALATGSHDDRAAMRFQPFDISQHRDKLRAGKNVLAIHGFNISPQSSDMLIAAGMETNEFDAEKAIEGIVDLDDFYNFWATEGLLGFWDGYSGNRNNFFVYWNPETSKLHFMPWGADSMFEKLSRLGNPAGHPLSVKTNGIVAHKLYQTDAGKQRYKVALKRLLSEFWNEQELLAEADRIEAMIKPHMSDAQLLTLDAEPFREFIQTRRQELEAEIADGMPAWTATTGEPPAMNRGPIDAITERKLSLQDNIWNAARRGKIDDIKRHLNKGVKIDAQGRTGRTVLGSAALGGQLDAVKFLISEGANINAKSRDGSTPLHSAAFLGRVAVVDALIKNKADVNATNNAGQTPLDVARVEWRRNQNWIETMADRLRMPLNLREVKSGREELARLLEENGGKPGRQPQRQGTRR